MASDVVINIRERGARGAGRNIDSVARSLDKLGAKGKVAGLGLRGMSSASRTVASDLRNVGGAALRVGGVIGAGLTFELVRSTKAWEEKRKIIAQTGAVLKSTGGKAHVTATDVDTLATSLSRKSGMDDEAIRGAQNLLLSFRDVRNEAGAGNDVFNQATQATTDLSAAMGMDLHSAALQVGKALNDPERGFKRLQRIGVSFSKSQENRIKLFSREGNRAAAQKVILQELSKEFGGSAAKQATALMRLKVSWGNIEEAIGQGVAPAIDAVAKKADHLFVRMEPDLLRLNKTLKRVWGRKDLTFEDKIDVSAQHVRAMMHPYLDELRKQVGAMHLGKQLADAFNEAAPLIADRAGQMAPRAAKAFLNAWLHANVWGKLFTVGLLASHFGVFDAAGKAAGKRMGRAISKRIGQRVAENAAADLAAGGMADAMRKSGGTYGNLFSRNFARAFTAVGAVLTAKAIYDKLTPEAKPQGALVIEQNIDKARKKVNALKERNAPLDQQLAAQAALQDAQSMLRPHGTPNVAPTPGGLKPVPGAVAGGLAAHGATRTHPKAARVPVGRQLIVLHSNLNVDGKTLAKALDRATADKAARR